MVLAIVTVLALWCGPALAAGPDDDGPAAPEAAATPPWRWPVAAPHHVLAPFDAPPSPYAAGHRGLDLAGSSSVVTAVDGGVVRFSGSVAGRGVVSVLHPGGIISTYEPVTGTVAAGDHVAAGTVIGHLEGAGASHCRPVVCLHLGARRGEEYLDPMLLLAGAGPSVLLPLAGADPGSQRSGTQSDGPAGIGLARKGAALGLERGSRRAASLAGGAGQARG